MIYVEDLQVSNMSKSAKGTVEAPGTNVAQKSGLNRAILDQGWGVKHFGTRTNPRPSVIPSGGDTASALVK